MAHVRPQRHKEINTKFRKGVASSGSRNIQLQPGFYLVSTCWFIKDHKSLIIIIIIIITMPQITLFNVSLINISPFIIINHLCRMPTSCNSSLGCTVHNTYEYLSM